MIFFCLKPDDDANNLEENYNSSTRNESEFKLAEKEIDENDDELSTSESEQQADDTNEKKVVLVWTICCFWLFI